MNKIKVLLVYIIYPLAMGSYFRKALEHREDVDLRVAGPYTGTFIPWMGGMTLPQKYAIPPDFPLPFGPDIGEFNYDMLKAMMGDWVPDVIINVDAGLHFNYKPRDGYVATVGTDPHVLNSWYDKPRKYSDKFFNMQKVYSKPGDIYLPYAYSKYDFYPTDMPPEEQGVDAVLIGMPYENRVQWVNELRRHGVSVILENGPVFDEARAAYNRGKIGLNWSSMDDLNCRAFELAAMKLCPVMNRVTDMSNEEFFGWQSPIFGQTFSSMQDAVDWVVWYKEHPENAQKVAEEAYQAVLPHTYDARVDQILRESGFVSWQDQKSG